MCIQQHVVSSYSTCWRLRCVYMLQHRCAILCAVTKCIQVTAGDVVTSPIHKLLLCYYSSCVEFGLEIGHVAVNRAKRIKMNGIAEANVSNHFVHKA